MNRSHLHGECPPDADHYHLLVMINTDEERSLSHIHMECCKTRSVFFSFNTWLLVWDYLIVHLCFAPAWVWPCCNYSSYSPPPLSAHAAWRHTGAGSSRSCWWSGWTLTYTQALSCSGRCTLATHKLPQHSAWSAQCSVAGTSPMDYPRQGTLFLGSLLHWIGSHTHC